MSDLQSLLAGTWELSRTVTGGHVMVGSAEFSLRPDGMLHYAESGTTLFSGADRPITFSRSYLYLVGTGPLTIFFDEPQPRLFQHVELVEGPAGWRGEGYHLCTPDTYRSRYDFGRDGQLHVRHAVAGPRKDYVIETQLLRPGAPLPLAPQDPSC